MTAAYAAETENNNMIGIGEKIRKYRTGRGISEDSLAQYLGVNCKDVIKWENGEEYPPVEAIAAAADYFEVTTDDLLCMDAFDHEDKIRGYMEKFQENIASGDLKNAISTIREGLIHFPKNFRFKCMLMYSLYLYCDRPSAVKHYSAEILDIYNDIQENCTDDAIRLEAKRLLCLHYYEDLHDAPAARAIASTLPDRKISREDMLPIVSEGEEKLTALQKNISSYADLLSDTIISYAEYAHSGRAKDRLALYELAEHIRSLIYTKEDYCEAAPARFEAMKQLAILYIAEGDADTALQCLENAAKCAVDYDSLNNVVHHTSPLINRLKFNKSRAEYPKDGAGRRMSDILLEDVLPMKCFEDIRYDKRMTELCKKLRP